MTSSGYESELTISELHADCLWYIFDFLDLKQKIGVVRVSKQFQSVVSEMLDRKQSRLDFVARECRQNRDWPLNPANLVLQDAGLLGSFLSTYRFGNVSEVCIHPRKFLNPDYEYGTMARTFWRTELILTGMHLHRLFANLPSLKSLILKHVIIETGPFGLELIAAFATRLAKLEVSGLKGEKARWLNTILRNASNLSELRIKKWRHISIDPNSNGIVPRLQTLILSDASFEDLGAFLCDKVHLRELKIEACLKPINWQQLSRLDLSRLVAIDIRLVRLDDLMAFVSNKPLLRKLSVRNLGFQECDSWRLNQRFDAFATLRQFHLTHTSLTGRLFKLLLDAMPFVWTLQLHQVYVKCGCREKEFSKKLEAPVDCSLCQKRFLLKVSNLARLRKLELIGFENEHSIPFLEALVELIDGGSLSQLRKLKCWIKYDFCIGLFQAFCRLATESPMESFVFVMPHNLQADQFSLQNVKPKNVFVTLS